MNSAPKFTKYYAVERGQSYKDNETRILKSPMENIYELFISLLKVL